MIINHNYINYILSSKEIGVWSSLILCGITILCLGNPDPDWFSRGVPVVICPLITPIIADQMLHAQWVERKHFGSWIQPLEPSVEDSDRLGYLGFQNSSILNPIPKAICGDFYRTVLAKHLSSVLSSISLLYLLSSLSLSIRSFSGLYQHQFPTVCRTASRLLWRHWSAGALAKVLHKEFNRRSRVVRVAEFWSKAGAWWSTSCQIQYSEKMLTYYVYIIYICVFEFQSAKSASPFFGVSMSRCTRTAQKLQLKPSRNWPEIGTLLPKLRSPAVALRDSAAVASKSSSQSPQSPLRFSSAALRFVLDSVHLWVARRFPSGFHEFSFLVLRVGLQPLRRNRPSCWHRLWKNWRNWTLTHKDSLKVSLV